ncbi:MAG: lectin-like protein [Planctomycetota bacterium]
MPSAGTAVAGRRPAGVPPDAVEFGGHFYKIYDGKMTWADAKAFCERRGGHLVTITSKEENDLVAKLDVRNPRFRWIGLSDERKEGEWEWVTGETVAFTAWQQGEPNNQLNEDYAAMRSVSRGWLDFVPNTPQIGGAICEWEPGAAAAPAPPENLVVNGSFEDIDANGKPSGWKHIQPCFDVVEERGNKWLKVRRGVAATQLVRLDREWSALIVSARMRGRGLKRGKEHWEWFRVALEFRDEAGKAVSYPWMPQLVEDSAWTTKKSPIEIPWEKGVRSLHMTIANFCAEGIGELDDVSVVPSASTQPREPVSFGGHRYKLYEQKMAWHDAKRFCEERGGHLVTITSKEENDFVTSLARASGDFVWIGFSDEAREGEWEWVTGEPSTFTAWGQGPGTEGRVQPDNWNGNQDVAILHRGANWKWDDSHAHVQLAFVCEWEPGAAVATAPVDLGRGLVGHWKLDEDTGTAARDSSGRGRHGKLSGDPTWRPHGGRLGGALELDGSGDHVELPALDLNSNTVTIGAWVKGHQQDDYAGLVFSRNRDTQAGVFVVGGNLRYYWNQAQYGWDSGLAIPVDSWAHVALVLEPTRATLYVNAIGVGHGHLHAIEEFNDVTYLGWDPVREHRSWIGLMDDVRIYDRALSAEEVKALHETGAK